MMLLGAGPFVSQTERRQDCDLNGLTPVYEFFIFFLFRFLYI